MTKTHYPIPSGCTGVTIEQEGEVVIVKFETEPKVERWRAEYGQGYVFIGHDTTWQGLETGHELDDYRYNSGNYYRTREEAEAELERRKKQ